MGVRGCAGHLGQLRQSLRAEPTLAGLPIVGFFSHVRAERGRLAREAGCTRAMPRSVFVQELDVLLTAPPGPG